MWLPHWQTDLHDLPGPRRDDRRGAAPGAPLVLTEAAAGAERLAAVSPAAGALGLMPGMSLADARALVPVLTVRPAVPRRAAAALGRLADWALRFTPRVSVCGTDGLWLDVSGCTHLFGGEQALLARLLAGVERRGFHARAALAETPGAAWAVAHHGAGGVVAAGAARAALDGLPVAALRLHEATVEALKRVGLRRIGDLARQPRASLVGRYGAELLCRLDQAFGRVPESITPRHRPPACRTGRVFAEPVADTGSVGAALCALLEELCVGLAHAQSGARQLALTLFRLDGGAATIRVGTSRPIRDPSVLARLFEGRLEGIDAGEGIEAMTLAVIATGPKPAHQTDLDDDGAAGEALADLVDRIVNRLGPDRVVRFGPRQSHQPDRAVMPLPPLARVGPRGRAPDWPEAAPRPVRLITPPAPVEAVAALPDGPPMTFRWCGRVYRIARASGPERIAGEGWGEDRPRRDYYRVEDVTGARFWLYREGLHHDRAAADGGPRWYLHGLFG